MIADRVTVIRNWASTRSRRILLAAVALVLTWAAVGCWHSVKPLPPDLRYRGEPVELVRTDLRFLTDLTYRGHDGRAVHEHEIFDEIQRTYASVESELLLEETLAIGRLVCTVRPRKPPALHRSS